jgi:hypothetical protein
MQTSCFDLDGFTVTPALFDDFACAQIESALTQVQTGSAGMRHLLDHPWCRALAHELLNHPALQTLVLPASVAVQCTCFEKSRDQNWLVPLHQDLSIPVAEKIGHPQLTGWSEKEGSLFVQPPVDVLERLVAVRLHIDDCGTDDGALKVVPGSPRRGRLSNDDALSERAASGETLCTVVKGGALVLKPLLLHASSKATGQSRRRVLHFVFGPPALPYGLRWRTES